jgi:hypothetical protein
MTNDQEQMTNDSFPDIRPQKTCPGASGILSATFMRGGSRNVFQPRIFSGLPSPQK